MTRIQTALLAFLIVGVPVSAQSSRNARGKAPQAPPPPVVLAGREELDAYKLRFLQTADDSSYQQVLKTPVLLDSTFKQSLLKQAGLQLEAAPSSAVKSTTKNFLRSAIARLTQMGADQIPFAGDQVGRLGERAVPQTKSGSEISAASLDRAARNGFTLAQGVVLIGLGEEAAASFASDPPLIKASKTAKAGGPIVKSLTWPNLIVAFLDFDDSDDDDQNLCEELFELGSSRCKEWSQHKDLRWRGNLIQEGMEETLARAADLAEQMNQDRISLADVKKALRIRSDKYELPEEVVRLAFGQEGMDQYKKLGPGLQRDKLIAASYVFGASWLYSGFAVMSLDLEKKPVP